MACTCQLLFVLLTCAKFGAGIRSENVDIATSDVDSSLKVLYKHCLTLWVRGLRDVDLRLETGPYPVVKRDDGEDDMSVSDLTNFFRSSGASCDFKMTAQPGEQHDIDIGAAPELEHYVQALPGYNERPEKKWFDLHLGTDVDEALKALYITAMRYKSSFYINDWVIEGSCGVYEVNDGSSKEEWKSKDCFDVMTNGGKVKFHAGEVMPRSGSEVQSNDITMDVSELSAGFQEECTSALASHADGRFSSIAPELCAGTKFQRDDRVITNVGWKKGENLRWK